MIFFEVERLIDLMRLSPYQAHIIRNFYYKYDLSGLKKTGPVVLAPYRSETCSGLRDSIGRLVMGRRADLIGSDRILAQNQRGIKVYPGGFFKASMSGRRCYADPHGNVISGKI